MKLASLKTGGRNGTLIVVGRDLRKAILVPGIVSTLQQALERWEAISGPLQLIYDDLNNGKKLAGTFDFDPAAVASPLPRSYQWLDASVYRSHVELIRKSRGMPMPENFDTDPLMYQGGSDTLLGPRDDIPVADERYGIDFEAEVAVVTDDVPMGIMAAAAAEHIRLVMLVNDVSLRNIAVTEIAKSLGFVQAKPASAFSPVAVTPQALGEAWRNGKLHLPLVTSYNGREFGHPNAGVGMAFDFPALIAHAAKTRFLSAGTIIGSGTVSNPDRSVGSSCLVERRTIERLETGEPVTPFMAFGDTVRIEMLDAEGKSIFGAIEQKIVKYKQPLC